MPPTRRRRPIPWLAGATLLAASLALPAAAKDIVGTNGPETLAGTNGADRIVGLGGNDRLQGLAGNDAYIFGNGWGGDILVEKPTYLVNGKKVAGGNDTLDFRGFTGGGVVVGLVPEWRGVSPAYSAADANSTADFVALGASRVENVIGSPDGDFFTGGAGPNRLVTGGSTPIETLRDFGGWNDGPGGLPELPASNDTFAGVAANSGPVLITDFGGAADAIDFRPLRLGQIYLSQVNGDGDPEGENLRVLTGVGAAGEVVVIGHFGEVASLAPAGQQGRIETLLFADATVSFAPIGRRAGGSRTVDGTTLLGKTETPRQQQLAKRAAATEESRLRPPDLLPRPTADHPGGNDRDRLQRGARHERHDRDGRR